MITPMPWNEYITTLMALKAYRRTLINDWLNAYRLKDTVKLDITYWADRIQLVNDAELSFERMNEND
jgi:hypothetical protein